MEKDEGCQENVGQDCLSIAFGNGRVITFDLLQMTNLHNKLPESVVDVAVIQNGTERVKCALICY